MKEMKLVVKIDAHFDWLNPPDSIQEEAKRKLIDNIVKQRADKLNTAVELIILEMIDDYQK